MSSVNDSEKKIRICYIGWADHVHLERWAGYFPKLDYEVSVISYTGRGNYPDEVKQYSLLDFPVSSYKLRHLYLRYLLSRIKPDIVHVHYAGFLASIRNIWKGPLVVTIWGSDIYRIDNQTETEKAYIQQGLRRADVITCDSIDLIRAIDEFSPGTKPRVSVIQWGVDTEVFNPTDKNSDLAVKLGITNRPVVISPRNFLPLYRLDEIVKAMRIVLDTVPDAILLLKRYNEIVEYSELIDKLIKSLGMDDSVFIIDRIEYCEMADFYRTGNVMVSVPESDGTPMSLLESMACGCPPVVSDLPSVREWVVHGENGFLVRVGDINGLATSINKILSKNSIASRFKMNNYEVVKRRASQAENMRKMSEIYKGIIE